jgi:hypothetical protein
METNKKTTLYQPHPQDASYHMIVICPIFFQQIYLVLVPVNNFLTKQHLYL